MTGEAGVSPSMIKQAVEAALPVEMTGHLGYEPHEAAGRGSGNSRHGTNSKTVQTTAGPVELECPGTATAALSPSRCPRAPAG